jgi:site-specific recombinase XerD
MLLLNNIKLSNVLSLNVEDVDFDKRTVNCTHKNETIAIKVSKTTIDIIQKYIQDERLPSNSNALFISRQGRRICAQSVEDMLKHYSKFCNLDITITPQLLNYYARQKMAETEKLQKAFSNLNCHIFKKG